MMRSSNALVYVKQNNPSKSLHMSRVWMTVDRKPLDLLRIKALANSNRIKKLDEHLARLPPFFRDWLEHDFDSPRLHFDERFVSEAKRGPIDFNDQAKWN